MLKKHTYTDKTIDLYRRIKPLRQLHNILLEIASKGRASATFKYAGKRWQIVEVE